MQGSLVPPARPRGAGSARTPILARVVRLLAHEPAFSLSGLMRTHSIAVGGHCRLLCRPPAADHSPEPAAAGAHDSPSAAGAPAHRVDPRPTSMQPSPFGWEG